MEKARLALGLAVVDAAIGVGAAGPVVHARSRAPARGASAERSDRVLAVPVDGRLPIARKHLEQLRVAAMRARRGNRPTVFLRGGPSLRATK
jgi:hypothetical protein